MVKRNITPFIHTQKQKQLLMKVTLMKYLNQSILLLYQTHKKVLGKGLGWIIDSVIDHNIDIPNYNPLASSSYIKLPKELYHPRKGLINIQNIDNNECFKWCFVRYLHPADHNPRRVTNSD